MSRATAIFTEGEGTSGALLEGVRCFLGRRILTVYFSRILPRDPYRRTPGCVCARIRPARDDLTHARVRAVHVHLVCLPPS